MCNTEKMIDRSSLTSTIISLFRTSLLFVALLSTLYAHFSFYLPVSSVLVVFSFLFLNIVFMCKKMTSYELRIVTKQKGLRQKGDDMVLDQSKNDTDFAISNAFEPDLIIFDRLDEKIYKKFELGPASNMSGSSLSLDACEEETSEIAEEDCLIEIPLGVDLKEIKRPGLMEESLVLQELQGLEDLNEVGGEDNLIEIDISMGSIRHSETGSVC